MRCNQAPSLYPLYPSQSTTIKEKHTNMNSKTRGRGVHHSLVGVGGVGRRRGAVHWRWRM